MCAASGPSSTAWVRSPANPTPLPWTPSALTLASPQVKGLSHLQLPETCCDAHAPWCGHHLQSRAAPEYCLWYKYKLMCTSQPMSMRHVCWSVCTSAAHASSSRDLLFTGDCKADGIQFSSRLKHKLVN